jgi:hypothetical protein
MRTLAVFIGCALAMGAASPMHAELLGTKFDTKNILVHVVTQPELCAVLRSRPPTAGDCKTMGAYSEISHGSCEIWTLAHDSSIWGEGETFQIDGSLGQELFRCALELKTPMRPAAPYQKWWRNKP